MNQPILKALEIYRENHGDLTEAIQWHLANGIVVSSHDCFMLGFYCCVDNTWNPVEVGKADCVHVSMCCGSMRSACLQIVENVPFVAYQREFKGDSRLRVTDFKKLFNKLK